MALNDGANCVAELSGGGTTPVVHGPMVDLPLTREVMRHLLTRQWERVDEQLAAGYRERFPPVSGEEG